MSRRRLLPLDDGSAVEIYRTESSIVYVAASYWKKGGRFSLHRIIVQSRIANMFGTYTIDTSNTLPKVQTIKQGDLDDLNDGQKAVARALYGYLTKSLDLEPKDKFAKHNIRFDLIVQSRDNPLEVRKYRLFTWTSKRVDSFRVNPSMKFKADHFEEYLFALSDQRVLCLMSNPSGPEGI